MQDYLIKHFLRSEVERMDDTTRYQFWQRLAKNDRMTQRSLDLDPNQYQQRNWVFHRGTENKPKKEVPFSKLDIFIFPQNHNRPKMKF